MFGLLLLWCGIIAVGYGVVQRNVNRSFNVFEAGSNPSDSDVLNILTVLVVGLIALQNLVRPPARCLALHQS